MFLSMSKWVAVVNCVVKFKVCLYKIMISMQMSLLPKH